VNLAKVVTGLASAVSHWRFRNIDRRLVLRLAIPGAIGALIGVTVLSNVDASTLKPILAGVLVLLALRILWRFSAFSSPPPVATDGVPEAVPTFDDRGVEVAAVAGGVTNGMIGSWGPEAALYRRHCVVGHYPFAGELRSLGFSFIDPDDSTTLRELIEAPDGHTLDLNEQLVKRHFSLEGVRRGIVELLDGAGWLP